MWPDSKMLRQPQNNFKRRQRVDALGNQRPNAVLHAIGVAEIAEAPRQAIQHAQTQNCVDMGPLHWTKVSH